jgi:hypothetical protein
MSTILPIYTEVDILRGVYIGAAGRIVRHTEYFYEVKLTSYHLDHMIGHVARVRKTNVRAWKGNSGPQPPITNVDTAETVTHVAQELREMRDHLNTLNELLDDLNL